MPEFCLKNFRQQSTSSGPNRLVSNFDETSGGVADRNEDSVECSPGTVRGLP